MAGRENGKSGTRACARYKMGRKILLGEPASGIRYSVNRRFTRVKDSGNTEAIALV